MDAARSPAHHANSARKAVEGSSLANASSTCNREVSVVADACAAALSASHSARSWGSYRVGSNPICARASLPARSAVGPLTPSSTGTSSRSHRAQSTSSNAFDPSVFTVAPSWEDRDRPIRAKYCDRDSPAASTLISGAPALNRTTPEEVPSASGASSATSAESGALSRGDACPPTDTFSGVTRSSPPSMLGRLLRARISFTVIHGAPAAVDAAAACSSKDPRIFSWRLNSRYRRSEEHTSELQSRPHLVCRLLLE